MGYICMFITPLALSGCGLATMRRSIISGRCPGDRHQSWFCPVLERNFHRTPMRVLFSGQFCSSFGVGQLPNSGGPRFHRGQPVAYIHICIMFLQTRRPSTWSIDDHTLHYSPFHTQLLENFQEIVHFHCMTTMSHVIRLRDVTPAL